MNSAAFGLGWVVWQRHRWGLGFFASYLFALIVLVRVLGIAFFGTWLPVLTAPFGFGLLYVMGLFADSNVDLGSTNSGYPSHLLLLPVRTSTLVVWPIVYGTGAVSGSWILYASNILTTTNSHAIVWWPAALLASLTASIQALAWSPMRLPYMRVILVSIILSSTLTLGFLGPVLGVAPIILGTAFLLTVPVATAVAIRGVSAARVGEARSSSWLPEAKVRTLSLKPFMSSTQAQVWLEWRRNGIMLPLLAGLTCGAFSILLVIPALTADTPLGIGSIQVWFSARMFLLALLSMPLTALMVGCCPYKSDTFLPDLRLQPFLVTRPLSSASVAGAKLLMATMSTLAAWAVVGVFLLLWLMLPAHSGTEHGTIGSLLVHVLVGKRLIFAIFMLFTLVSWTWINQIVGLWVEFSGNRALIILYGIAWPMLCFAVIGTIFQQSVENPAVTRTLIQLLPVFALGLALLKLGVIFWTIIAVRHEQVLSPVALAAAICVWIVLLMGTASILHWVLPTGAPPLPVLLLGVFLYLPLARLLAAPLALHWNRHR